MLILNELYEIVRLMFSPYKKVNKPLRDPSSESVQPLSAESEKSQVELKSVLLLLRLLFDCLNDAYSPGR